MMIPFCRDLGAQQSCYWTAGAFQISKSLADMLFSIVLVVGFALGVTGRLAGQSIATVSFGLLALFLLMLVFRRCPVLLQACFR